MAEAVGGTVIVTGHGTYMVVPPSKEKQTVEPGSIIGGPYGSGAGQPSMTATPVTPGPPGTIPTRANNPGSILDGRFARSQPGYAGPGPIGVSGHRFASFVSPEAGAAAIVTA